MGSVEPPGEVAEVIRVFWGVLLGGVVFLHISETVVFDTPFTLFVFGFLYLCCRREDAAGFIPFGVWAAAGIGIEAK